MISIESRRHSAALMTGREGVRKTSRSSTVVNNHLLENSLWFIGGIKSTQCMATFVSEVAIIADNDEKRTSAVGIVIG
ncbi:MAG: hypothetical protein OEV57_03300 [Dehalococcoidia bacterium]|nr:hypothetical protein [Dehalococcoidia bacterium]